MVLSKHGMGSRMVGHNMKFSQLSRLFYQWGIPIKVEHYTPFCDYLHAMLKRNRVMVIEKDNEIVAVLLFFITYDYNKVYKKGSWDFIDDNEFGHQIYVDKLVCKHFDRDLHNAIEEAIVDKYPQVTEAIYHREPRDRRTII